MSSNAKKPKKPAPPAPSALLRHAYHVHATRSTAKNFSTFSGVIRTQDKVLDDDGFFAVRDFIAKSLDADAAGKATQGAFLLVKSLSYLGEASAPIDTKTLDSIGEKT